MKKRTPLSDRPLPDYTKGEEQLNMISHIAGGGLGLLALVLCVCRAGDGYALTGAIVYGLTMIGLYTVSSVYHGLRRGMGKKVMQVIDHCAIYFLISGCYTLVLLGAFRPVYPGVAWGLLALEWGLTALAVTLTAIDLKKYSIFSMICYIGMGWAVIPFWRETLEVLSPQGFAWLLAGGIAYSVGAIFYGVGSKRKWMHGVFHIFVVLGSVLQFVSIYGYTL